MPDNKSRLPQENIELKPENNASVNTQKIKDNKNYVTPWAFSVSESIYGKPLAKPKSRIAAILIDLCFIVLLTHLSDFMLFGFIGWTLLNAARHLKQKSSYGITRKVLRIVGGFCAFVFIVGLFDFVTGTAHYQGQEIAATQTIDDEMAEMSSLPEDDSSPDDKPAEVPGIMELLESRLAEMGINFGWAAFYFSVFTGWFSGQTPGKKLLGIKVIKQDGSDLNLWDAFGRYGGYTAGFATGLMGFLQIYWDPNRQAIQDKICGTLVVIKNAPVICIDTQL